jgi:hypothetical protein
MSEHGIGSLEGRWSSKREIAASLLPLAEPDFNHADPDRCCSAATDMLARGENILRQGRTGQKNQQIRQRHGKQEAYAVYPMAPVAPPTKNEPSSNASRRS